MRKSEIKRKTKETDIQLTLNLDGKGKYDIDTGIGFFDHMMELFSKHALFDLDLKIRGDLNVDEHHTVEDAGIVFGEAFKTALGDKKGIKRYATVFLPMDEALAMVSVDISGRPYCVFDASFEEKKAGGTSAQVYEECIRALAVNAGVTLHVRILYGSNTHHMIEAVFKGLARALREAAAFDPREKGVPSTKGLL